MTELSIVIPWRDSGDYWREQSFEWNVSRYCDLFPDSELLIVDSDDEQFHRGRSRNEGVALAEGEFVLMADADTITYPSSIEAGMRMIRDGSPWVIPYDNEQYYNADQKSSEWILTQPPSRYITPGHIKWEHKITSWGGHQLIRREDFLRVGGYDERFQGWGYEDNAMQVALDTIVGPHERVAGAFTIHIWHEYSHATTFGQPHIDANRAMFQEYERVAGDVEAMKQLVAWV